MTCSIRNVSIDASAGCGKTETLGMRMLAMMLAGIPPETICAMTFTRAAANEIYERLLSLLWNALKSEENLERLRRSVAGLGVFADGFEPPIDRASVSALLRKLVDSMQTIGIGTLDSFFARIVRAFSAELGLPSNAAIMDAATQELRTGEIIRPLFQKSGDETTGNWLESAKELFFGDSAKRLLDPCLELLKQADSLPILRISGSVWDDPSLPHPLSKEERAELFDVCAAWIAELPDLREKKFSAFLSACRDAEKDSSFSAENRKMLNEFFNVWDDVKSLNGAKKAFAGTSAETEDAIRALVRRAGEIRLHQASVRTRAIREMTLRHAALYRRMILNEGLMAFQDLPRLLAGSDDSGWLMEIAYRLNGRIRHWLLDEFQDTSREQWAVLDRILDGKSGGWESLFLVGDAKQAIYGWRKGDSKLMDEVRREYGLESIPQNKSFRYGRSICEALNLMFDRSALEASAFPPATVRRWIGGGAGGWREHVAGLERPGELSVVQVLLAKESSQFVQDDFHAFAAIIDAELERTRWQEKCFSVAILVRRGEEAFKLKNAMADRNPALAERMIWEGDEIIFSDPVVRAAVSFFVFLQHPADVFHAEIVRMTPSFESLLPCGESALNAVRAEWSVILNSTGFQGAIETLLKRIPESLRTGSPVDALLQAAKSFDASGRPLDAVAFREFVKNTKRRDAVDPGKIRILTMHGSKGLTFDMVFSILTENKTYGNFRKPDWNGFLADERSIPPRALYSPGPPAVLVEELRRIEEEARSDAAYEALCLLYVSLTRAKYGSFLLCPSPGKEKLKRFHPEAVEERKGRFRKMRFAELVDQSYRLQDFVFDSVFGDSPEFAPETTLNLNEYPPARTLVWRHGERDWFEKIPQKEKPAPRSWSIAWNGNGFRRREPLSPSEAESGIPDAVHADFSGVSSREQAIEFGVKIHAWMERLEWVDDFSAPPEAPPELADHLRACFSNPSFQRFFRTPENPCVLLRETPFGVPTDDGGWLNGRFDRVHLHAAPDGSFERVEILDFKSSRFPEGDPEAQAALAERHRPQLLLYRKAAASLFRVPEDRIRMLIVLTRSGDVLEINDFSAT